MPAHAQPPRVASEPSRIAGRYRVLSTLGQGGAGAVLRVYDESAAKELALKRLSENASARVNALFEQEYYTLASLRHPHLVEVYEYGTDDGIPFYTMELLAGSDLSQLAPLPWATACAYLRDAAAGLSVLHARKLLHRDVSPRNLWRTPSGLVKLIDFGALTAFGSARDVVGTPPMVAPEALSGQALDQRTDLYALGALLYWLITGSHAYPARHLRDLPSRWGRGFIPASQVLANLGRADLPALPAEMDALVEALLSADPRGRPGSAGEVYERLSMSAGLSREAEKAASSGTLHTPMLVGREHETAHFRRALRQGAEGMGRATLIEGESGAGRSRMLQEVALEARLRGATVVLAQAVRLEGHFALGHTLARQLFSALPEQARSAAAPYAPTLAALVPELGEETPSAPVHGAAAEGVAQLTATLVTFIGALSQAAPIVILVDDAERLDDASAALLLSLAASAKGARVLLAATLSADALKHGKPRVRALRAQARKLTLVPLDASQTRALLSSLFGEVPHLPRLAEKVYRATQGLPARIIDLAQQMLRLGLVSYVDGTWLLPQELPSTLLLEDPGAALAAQLSRLSAEARALGRLLSLHEGLASHEMLRSVSELDARARVEALQNLLSEGVLVGDGSGYHMPDRRYRAALRAQLSEAETKSLRARIGRFLLASDRLEPTAELDACMHVLAAGPDDKVAARVSQIASHLLLEDPDRLREAVAPMEEAVAMFRAQGKSDYAQLSLLSALAVAGFFVDRNLSLRYADDALDALSRTLGLKLARRLSLLLGKRIGLIIGLTVGAARFGMRKKDPFVPAFPDAIRMFFNCNGSVLGMSAVCIDIATARRCTQMIEIWGGLGPKHFTSIVLQIGRAMICTMQDRPAQAMRLWAEVITKLESKERALGMPEDARVRYLAGALYACGVLACLREKKLALSYAERLDQLGPYVYKMSADQIRTLYYAHQGNLPLFEHYRGRVELAAVQYGSAWQAEVWGAGAGIGLYMRTYDGASMKQTLEQLKRLAQVIPTQKLPLSRCQGSYLLLRRRYGEARSLLDGCLSEEPLGIVGWARSHGSLARLLNALGEHAQAHEVCERAMRALTPEDLEFHGMHLGLQIEHALALAGLGKLGEAARDIEALLARCGADASPLALGALHEARARIALANGDPGVAREHQASMERAYIGTQIPTLIARCESFARELRAALEAPRDADGQPIAGAGIHSEHTSAEVTALERVLTSTASAGDGWAERALELLLSAREEGAIYAIEAARPVLRASTSPVELPSEVETWFTRRVGESCLVGVTETASLEGSVISDPDTLDVAGTFYRLHWLRGRGPTEDETHGVLLTISAVPRANAPRDEVLNVLARKLASIPPPG